MMRYHKTLYKNLGFIALAGLSLLASCKADKEHPGYEFMPDMYQSPSYETYSENPMFADSLSARNPVEGTVARGQGSHFPYPANTDGYIAAGNDLITVPGQINESYLAAGKDLYKIYCMHCHGETGNGDGSLIATGKFPAPPSYANGNSSRGGMMKDLTAGKIFHAITYGLNMMGPHASQINHEERWKITAWVMELQKSNSASMAESNIASADTTTTNATN